MLCTAANAGMETAAAETAAALQRKDRRDRAGLDWVCMQELLGDR
jgi:hypothetical protein